MTWHEHPDASLIVRKHWHEAQCFILAEQEPCITIALDEVGNIAENRQLVTGTIKDLENWDPPTSRFIAVLLCPGDDTDALAKHVATNRLDSSRVHFYLHKQAKTESLLPWKEAGFSLDRVDDCTPDGRPFTDWGTLHKALGLHFNLQILTDFL